MKPILEQIYDGEVNGFEYIFTKGKEYGNINKKIEEEKRYLREKLWPDDCNRIDEFETLCGQASEFEKKAVFSYGFKLGAAMMLEVLTDRKE